MSLSREEGERFTEWLNQNTKLRERSVRDVVSRLRRVMGMMDPLKPQTKEELTYRLSEQREFNQTSASVRSQLKRAAMLYRRFCQEAGVES